ncbi:DUF4861 family protein [Candidatus Poribacteria bacterium]
MTVNYRGTLICFFVSTLLLSALMSGCSMLGGKRDETPKIEMIVENPLPIKRTDEFVVLKVAQLKEMAPNFSQDMFIVLQAGSNEEIPYQVDDMDNDGELDEIAMVMDMEPGEQKRIVIRYAPSNSPESRAVRIGYEKRTRAAMHPEYKGIGWESELVAYRIYPDYRNSISVFGKQEPGLSLDKFAASLDGFSKLQPWGVSVLDGGKSLGCGGFGIWHDGELMKPMSDGAASYTRIAADGPIRAAVQVIHDNWRVGDQTLRVTATYSIFAGQRWTRSEVKIEGANNPVKVAAGLMKSEAAKLTRDDKDGLLYTWGEQSHRDTPDSLGMAMIYPTESFESFHDDRDSGAYLTVLNPGADNEIAYWSLAAWSSGEIGIKREKQFTELASSIGRRLKHPLTVTIMPVQLPPAEGEPQETN